MSRAITNTTSFEQNLAVKLQKFKEAMGKDKRHRFRNTLPISNEIYNEATGELSSLNELIEQKGRSEASHKYNLIDALQILLDGWRRTNTDLDQKILRVFSSLLKLHDKRVSLHKIFLSFCEGELTFLRRADKDLSQKIIYQLIEESDDIEFVRAIFFDHTNFGTNLTLNERFFIVSFCRRFVQRPFGEYLTDQVCDEYYFIVVAMLQKCLKSNLFHDFLKGEVSERLTALWEGLFELFNKKAKGFDGSDRSQLQFNDIGQMIISLIQNSSPKILLEVLFKNNICINTLNIFRLLSDAVYYAAQKADPKIFEVVVKVATSIMEKPGVIDAIKDRYNDDLLWLLLQLLDAAIKSNSEVLQINVLLPIKTVLEGSNDIAITSLGLPWNKKCSTEVLCKLIALLNQTQDTAVDIHNYILTIISYYFNVCDPWDLRDLFLKYYEGRVIHAECELFTSFVSKLAQLLKRNPSIYDNPISDIVKGLFIMIDTTDSLDCVMDLIKQSSKRHVDLLTLLDFKLLMETSGESMVLKKLVTKALALEEVSSHMDLVGQSQDGSSLFSIDDQQVVQNFLKAFKALVDAARGAAIVRACSEDDESMLINKLVMANYKNFCRESIALRSFMGRHSGDDAKILNQLDKSVDEFLASFFSPEKLSELIVQKNEDERRELDQQFTRELKDILTAKKIDQDEILTRGLRSYVEGKRGMLSEFWSKVGGNNMDKVRAAEKCIHYIQCEGASEPVEFSETETKALLERKGERDSTLLSRARTALGKTIFDEIERRVSNNGGQNNLRKLTLNPGALPELFFVKP